MPSVVSTGQFTIVDNNDAKTITTNITASLGIQQNYTKDDTTTTFSPSYATTNNVLTPVVMISSSTGPKDLIATQSASLSSVSWSTAATGTPNIVNAGTNGDTTNYSFSSTTFALTLLTNTLTKASPTKTFYFTAVYTDPVTSLQSSIMGQITIGLLITGTNALYIVMEGDDVLPKTDTEVRNSVTLTAKLMRGANEETSLAASAYKWYKIVGGAAQELLNTHADWSSTVASRKFKFLNAAGDTEVAPLASSGYHTGKKLVIFDDAVSGTQAYRVDILDDESTSPYTKYFTIQDKGDPYQVTIKSTRGDKLQNGQGSTTLSVSVTKAGKAYTIPSGWTYKWSFSDAAGRPAAFVNAAAPFSSACSIASNTTSAVTVSVPVGASTPALAANDVVKLVKSNGVAEYYKVATAVSAVSNAASATTVAISLAVFSTDWPMASLAANAFTGGKAYKCIQNPTTATLVVTGDDIDGQGVITVDTMKPDTTS